MAWMKYLALPALALLAAPVALGPLTATELGGGRHAIGPVPVTVDHAATDALSDLLPAFGRIAPADILHVPMPPAQAPVRWMDLRPGDLVQAGQVLARLDTEEAARQLALAHEDLRAALADVRVARSQLTQAETDLEQRLAAFDMLVQLAQTGASSAGQRHDAERARDRASLDVEAAHARLDMAMAQAERMRVRLAAAERHLAGMVITAPADGRVLQVGMEPGATPPAGTPLLSIAVADRMQAVLQVTPDALSRIAPGDAARIWLPGDRLLEGRVSGTRPGDAATGGLAEVRVDLPRDIDGALIQPGTGIRAEITTDTRLALTVPLSALVALPGGPGVLRVIDGRAVATPVTLAARPGEARAEILGGLPEGAPYVARAGAIVRDGDAVRPLSADSPTPETAPAPATPWQEAAIASRPGRDLP